MITRDQIRDIIQSNCVDVCNTNAGVAADAIMALVEEWPRVFQCRNSSEVVVFTSQYANGQMFDYRRNVFKGASCCKIPHFETENGVVELHGSERQAVLDKIKEANHIVIIDRAELVEIGVALSRHGEANLASKIVEWTVANKPKKSVFQTQIEPVKVPEKPEREWPVYTHGQHGVYKWTDENCFQQMHEGFVCGNCERHINLTMHLECGWKIITEAEARSLIGPLHKEVNGYRYTGVCKRRYDLTDGVYYVKECDEYLSLHGDYGEANAWCYIMERIEMKKDARRLEGI